MRFICFILPWMQRSGTPGRSLRSTSYVYFTCLHVDRNTSTFACAKRTTHFTISAADCMLSMQRGQTADVKQGSGSSSDSWAQIYKEVKRLTLRCDLMKAHRMLILFGSSVITYACVSIFQSACAPLPTPLSFSGPDQLVSVWMTSYSMSWCNLLCTLFKILPHVEVIWYLGVIWYRESRRKYIWS